MIKCPGSAGCDRNSWRWILPFLCVVLTLDVWLCSSDYLHFTDLSYSLLASVLPRVGGISTFYNLHSVQWCETNIGKNDDEAQTAHCPLCTKLTIPPPDNIGSSHKQNMATHGRSSGNNGDHYVLCPNICLVPIDPLELVISLLREIYFWQN